MDRGERGTPPPCLPPFRFQRREAVAGGIGSPYNTRQRVDVIVGLSNAESAAGNVKDFVSEGPPATSAIIEIVHGEQLVPHGEHVLGSQGGPPVGSRGSQHWLQKEIGYVTQACATPCCSGTKTPVAAS